MFHNFILPYFKFLLFANFGGGGGGGDTTSGGNDNLWNTQASKVNQDMAMSGQMFDTYQKYAAPALATASSMNDEAQSGVLTTRARTTAGADADQATAQGLAAGNRSLERYGSTMNPNAMAHTTNATALQGAANKAGAMSKATQWGENQKWARNSDMLSAASGQQGTAVQMSSNANQGLSTMGGMQNSQNYMDSQNASGAGKFGAYAATSMFKADGGYIDKRKGLRLASGGAVSPIVGWRERMASMPTVSRSSGNYGSTLGNVVSGAAPIIAGKGAKYLADQTGLTEGLNTLGRNGLRAASDGIKNALNTEFSPDKVAAAQSAETSSVADAATSAGSGTADAVVADAAAQAGADAATATAEQVAAAASAEASSVAAAEGAALASEGSLVAANSWNPVGWIGAGLMAADALSRADGGPIGLGAARQDITQGGPISGPGTSTSDSIPVEASDGEFMLNAEATEMVGREKLEAINAAGLRRRRGGEPEKVGLGRAMAMCGNDSMKGLRKYG